MAIELEDRALLDIFDNLIEQNIKYWKKVTDHGPDLHVEEIGFFKPTSHQDNGAAQVFVECIHSVQKIYKNHVKQLTISLFHCLDNEITQIWYAALPEWERAILAESPRFWITVIKRDFTELPVKIDISATINVPATTDLPATINLPTPPVSVPAPASPSMSTSLPASSSSSAPAKLPSKSELPSNSKLPVNSELPANSTKDSTTVQLSLNDKVANDKNSTATLFLNELFQIFPRHSTSCFDATQIMETSKEALNHYWFDTGWKESTSSSTARQYHTGSQRVVPVKSKDACDARPKEEIRWWSAQTMRIWLI